MMLVILDLQILRLLWKFLMQRSIVIKVQKRLYAKNGIVEYLGWLILIEGRIEVYTQPLISASRPDYQYQINYYVPDAVPFLLDSVRIAEIPVDEILPRVKA